MRKTITGTSRTAFARALDTVSSVSTVQPKSVRVVVDGMLPFTSIQRKQTKIQPAYCSLTPMPVIRNPNIHPTRQLFPTKILHFHTFQQNNQNTHSIFEFDGLKW